MVLNEEGEQVENLRLEGNPMSPSPQLEQARVQLIPVEGVNHQPRMSVSNRG
jgi:hypothetical protein